MLKKRVEIQFGLNCRKQLGAVEYAQHAHVGIVLQICFKGGEGGGVGGWGEWVGWVDLIGMD